MRLFLFLVVVAMVLGIIGAVAHGLFYLLLIGILIFVIALAHGGRSWRRSGRRPVR